MKFLEEVKKIRGEIINEINNTLKERKHFNIKFDIPIVNNYLNDYLNEIIIGYNLENKSFILDDNSKIQYTIEENMIKLEQLILILDAISKKEYIKV